MKRLIFALLVALPCVAQEPEPDLSVTAIVADTTGAWNALQSSFPDASIVAQILPYTSAAAGSIVAAEGVVTLPWSAWQTSSASVAFALGKYEGDNNGNNKIDDALANGRGMFHLNADPLPAGHIELWYMGLCPYGLLAVEELLSELRAGTQAWDSITLNYVLDADTTGALSSLHGEPEIEEAIFQRMLLREQGIDALLQWVDVRAGELGTGPFDPSMSELRDGVIPKSPLGESSGADSTYVGSDLYDQIKATLLEDATRARELGIRASPTIVVGGQWVTTLDGLSAHFQGATRKGPHTSRTTGRCGNDPSVEQCGDQ